MLVTLDRKELDVMELFWREARDLTHKEVLTLVGKQVSRNAVYTHLNSLLEKGAILVGPSVRCGRTYGRTFCVAISRQEYAAMQLRETLAADEGVLRAVFFMLLDAKQITDQTLDALSEKIQKKRKELQG